ncbi:MAG: DNA polymerase III subunit beta [Candidatus Omnitrophota bacterium]
MEFTIEKNAFLKALGLVCNVASLKANTLPILSNILIETEGKEKISLVGTDLEVGICTKSKAGVKEEGSITVPARKIFDIVRELPEGEVAVTVGKNHAVNIKTGKSLFKIMGLQKDDYPKLPAWKEENAYELEQAVLKEGLSLTVFAVSSDETRYVLNGLLLSIKEGKIRFVATDGRRLAIAERAFEGKQKKPYEAIIPTKAINEICKITDWEGNVKIIPSQNQVVFDFGETFLISRLIEGTFPNYEQVLPKEEKTKSTLSREAFLQSVRRASLLTSVEAPAVKLDFVKGKVLLSSRAPNLGEAKEELDAETSGKEVSIGFNPHYLADALKNLDCETVQMSITEPDKPGLMTGKEGYRYVIMPMQLN